MMGRVQRRVIGMLVTAACSALGACGHSGGGAAVVSHHSVPAAGSGADRGPVDLVSAVSLNGSGDGAVGLKFQLAQRPVAGQSVEIVLRLIANRSVEHLEARFHSDEGLDIIQGADFDSEGHVEAGSAVDHALTVVPAHEGVSTIQATVTAGTAADALIHSFVIPIVVGAAATPPAADTSAPH